LIGYKKKDDRCKKPLLIVTSKIQHPHLLAEAAVLNFNRASINEFCNGLYNRTAVNNETIIDWIHFVHLNKSVD